MNKNIALANSQNFQNIVESNVLVFVDFYADWCGPCNIIAPSIDKLAEEYTMLERWEQARRNALMLCGEAAHKVQVNILSVWWDRRTRCDYIYKIIIYDGSDKLLWYEQFDAPIPPIEEESLSGMLEDEQYLEDQEVSATVEDLSEEFTIDESLYEEDIPGEDRVEDSSLYDEQYMEYLAEMKQCDDSCDDAYGFPVLNATYVLDRPPSISFPLVYMQVDASTKRIPSREEVIKLGKEHKAAADWECTRVIIASTYGKNAYRAEIHYVAQCYNDEYWYDEGQETVVYDIDGERLHFNPLLPIWRTEEFLVELGASADEDEWQWADAEDSLAGLGARIDEYRWLDIAGDRLIQRMFAEAGGVSEGRYILDSPPDIALPELYINE